MFNNFEGILIVGVPVYCTLLITMVWRSNARVSASNLPRLLCGIGGVVFMISDGIIAFDKFYNPIPNAKYLIMSTYYFAQLGITLSILDHELIKTKKSTKSN